MKLLIGIPSLDFMHTEFVKSLTALVMRLKDDGISFDVEIMSGTLVYFARDNIACKAITTDTYQIVWIGRKQGINHHGKPHLVVRIVIDFKYRCSRKVLMTIPSTHDEGGSLEKLHKGKTQRFKLV